jgi:hypothetical protein
VISFEFLPFVSGTTELFLNFFFDWERKGFMTTVGYGQGEQGGYVLVVHITVDRMTFLSL